MYSGNRSFCGTYVRLRTSGHTTIIAARFSAYAHM